MVNGSDGKSQTRNYPVNTGQIVSFGKGCLDCSARHAAAHTETDGRTVEQGRSRYMRAPTELIAIVDRQ